MAQKPSNKITLSVLLQPNAKKNEIVGYQEQYLKIRIHAPATEGKANKALIKFLADYFDVPKSQVTILKGLQSRYKIVCITGSNRSTPFV